MGDGVTSYESQTVRKLLSHPEPRWSRHVQSTNLSDPQEDSIVNIFLHENAGISSLTGDKSKINLALRSHRGVEPNGKTAPLS